MRPTLTRMEIGRWAELRREYSRAGLRESEVHADPVVQLESWLKEAHDADVLEPTAMTLATTGEDGWPNARVVLLKMLDARGLVFFTNYESQKGRELERSPRASAVLVWLALERQVRVVGAIEKTSEEESRAYFASRPRGSQLGAWASAQSQRVASRQELEERLRAAEAKFEGRAVPLPEHWGGFRLVPREVEFWQGRPNRMHDRLRYVRDASGGFALERLCP